MVSRSEMKDITLMYNAIKQAGTIDIFDLQDSCNKMSISRFNLLKPYLLKKYEDVIKYEKSAKRFTYVYPNGFHPDFKTETQVTIDEELAK